MKVKYWKLLENDLTVIYKRAHASNVHRNLEGKYIINGVLGWATVLTVDSGTLPGNTCQPSDNLIPLNSF